MFDALPTYFGEEELKALRALEGQHILRVFYTIWRNNADKGGGFESLDWVEIQFESGHKITFHADEEEKGIEITPLNFGLEQTRIQQQFRGQVSLERVDMSQSPVWESLIGAPITAIGLLHMDKRQHPNHVFQLELGETSLEFTREEAGLLVRPVANT
ncbi:MAG: hypothetical protein AAFV07_19215 [Bacteroidota bacterium]